MTLVASVLTGCAASTSVEPVTIPPSLKAACAAPVVLPERDLTDREVEILWGRDRSALRSCGDRHGALSDAVD